MTGEFVVVRTRNAGVHCGVLAESAGTAVVLTAARRVWRWRGANTLHEMALRGVDDGYSRVSEPVGKILLTEAIEVLPCATEAQRNLSRSRWPA